jgi:CheY-like chemotaxis protein
MLRSRYREDLVLIAVSGYATAEDRKGSQEAGIDAHVQKPIDLHMLESILTSLLSRRSYPSA